MELLIQAWLYEKRLLFNLPYICRCFVQNCFLIPAFFNLGIAFCAIYYCDASKNLYDFIEEYKWYFLLSCVSAFFCISMVMQNKFSTKSSKPQKEKNIYVKPTYSEYIAQRNYEHSDFFWLRWKFTRSLLALFSFIVFTVFSIWSILHREPSSMPPKWRESFSGKLIEFHCLILNLCILLLLLCFCIFVIIRLTCLIVFLKFPKVALLLCFCGKKRRS
ncbi:unnamed protein product [Moneuplotes crassus]|uniref:Uncharacterized protein n=1 Tax=Euplotes crassus TaxID=5936 RepID=A0AAD1XJL5_EUPCR|nr:unnamed protein product [Moneuplotes crassus]